MNRTWFSYHSKCIFTYKIIRKNNRRTLAVVDKSCNYVQQLIYSKEKLKNLFDRNRITNLLYLEGLVLLEGLRKSKGNKEKEQ